MDSSLAQPRPRIFYGWFVVVVAVSALAILIAAGVRSAPGVFILPMQQNTGWSIGAISFAVSMGLLVLGFTAPVSGWFIDRFGPRRVAPSSGGCSPCASAAHRHWPP